MKKIFIVIAIAIGILFVLNFIITNNFDKATRAYDKGDYKTALREWQPRAEQGEAVPQYNLGLLYDNGQGVPQDYGIAAKWYKLSAEQGFAKAQFNLGLLYYKGAGFSQDYSKAAKWWILSAEQGLVSAQRNLGFLYELGDGVPQDYIRAHMWHNLAVANGDEKSVEARDYISEQMTPEQIGEAQKMATKCKAKDYKGC